MNRALVALCGGLGFMCGASSSGHACSLGTRCIGEGMKPGGPDFGQVMVPANLPGVVLDPVGVYYADGARDVSAYALEGTDGHRVGFVESAIQPYRQNNRKLPMYGELDAELRAGVTYELVGPAAVPECSTSTRAVGFTVTAATPSLPNRAPRLSVEVEEGPVSLYGSAPCQEDFDLPAVRLVVDAPAVWDSWTDVARVSVLVDDEAYSNWSVETEGTTFASAMDETVVFARCGRFGSGGGVEAGHHRAELVFDLPGHGRFVTNPVEFELDCESGAIVSDLDPSGCRAGPRPSALLLLLLLAVFARWKVKRA